MQNVFKYNKLSIGSGIAEIALEIKEIFWKITSVYDESNGYVLNKLRFGYWKTAFTFLITPVKSKA